MVSISIFSSEENQLQVEKNGKNAEVFFITLFAQKKPERGSFEVSLCLKQSLHKPRKINETMNHMGSQS